MYVKVCDFLRSQWVKWVGWVEWVEWVSADNI